MHKVFVTCVIALATALTTHDATHATAMPRTVPDPLYGITFDDVDRTREIVAATRHLSRMPTSRIVFDEDRTAAQYAPKVRAIRATSYVMGELVDSSAMTTLTIAEHRQRTTRYLRALGTDVDIWEIGNEVNGEWIGPTPSVVAKVANAYDQVTAAGRPTALTLYYNPDCWSRRAHQMLPWTRAHIPSRMKGGLDYVFVSYYEHDCNGHRPTLAEWNRVFDRLHALFPNSKLGFGEVGAAPRSPIAVRRATMRRYYGMPVTTPRFVGGNFWWYGTQDLLPWATRPLWRTLDAEFLTY